MDFQKQLTDLYGEEIGKSTHTELLSLIDSYSKKIKKQDYRLSEKDAILITYGDQVQSSPGQHIKSFHQFYGKYLSDSINTVHFLPFYPYTSDDGFSVVDYLQIDPKLGAWEDVESISKDCRLMFDAVVNHISSQSMWFKAYLAGDPNYQSYFIDIDPKTDLSKVVRPRALPLLTKFKTPQGEKHVWTTFSEDQIDINIQSPKVLLEVINALLCYAEYGAKLIRLDAIAFLWKEIGTTCLHLPKTHQIIQLFKSIFDELCPDVTIITETNVPHQENISYFGNGHNEAQMVYNFSLPPLLAHAILRQDCSTLSQWASTLELPSSEVCFFNFTASHDGIGVRPATGILPNEEIEFLAQNSIDHGGHVSYKNNEDGSQSPYELNCNYLDFISSPEDSDELRAKKFLCTQSVMLSMPGVPGIYFHSLLGSRNDPKGVEATGRFRSINREKLNFQALCDALDKPNSFRSRIFTAYSKMLQIRQTEAAFDPYGEFEILNLHKGLFAIHRKNTKESLNILSINNLTEKTIKIDNLPISDDFLIDLVSGKKLKISSLTIDPYKALWLKRI